MCTLFLVNLVIIDVFVLLSFQSSASDNVFENTGTSLEEPD